MAIKQEKISDYFYYTLRIIQIIVLILPAEFQQQEGFLTNPL